MVEWVHNQSRLDLHVDISNTCRAVRSASAIPSMIDVRALKPCPTGFSRLQLERVPCPRVTADVVAPARRPIQSAPNGDSCCCQCSTARSRFTSAQSASCAVVDAAVSAGAVQLPVDLLRGHHRGREHIASDCSADGARIFRMRASSSTDAYVSASRLTFWIGAVGASSSLCRQRKRSCTKGQGCWTRVQW